jgi:hypothetical protein
VRRRRNPDERHLLASVMLKISIVVACISLWTLLAAGQIAIPGELDYEFVSQPGEQHDGTIEIANTTDEPVEVSISHVDYLFFADGTTSYPEPGSVERSNASWISVYAPDQLIIPARDTVAVNFRINTPNDSSLRGTYWSMFLVAPVPSPVDAAAGSEGLGVNIVVRYGIQIITHIGDTGERKIQIMAADLTLNEEGTRLLLVDVENVGERWVRPEPWAEIFDETGSLVARVDGARLRIYPGTSVRYRFDLPDLDPGPYKALVVFDNGDEYVWGAQYNLEL